MGYTTRFTGAFRIAPPLSDPHRAYLVAFSRTRRMARDAAAVAGLPDPLRDAAGLQLGEDACFYVGGSDAGVLDFNSPPAGQPGLWCDWRPSADGASFGWNGTEKSYMYEEWVLYLVEEFLERWGYVADGTVRWTGEGEGDLGRMVLKDNVLLVYAGREDDPGETGEV
ncbi:hypothetical protein DFJ74DRAFT_704920 [Hyaloraphidium curvatum]|nr:hypothetical protein DFJ74DRAFT_704920 [Hyaloraphidium curvatum]